MANCNVNGVIFKCAPPDTTSYYRLRDNSSAYLTVVRVVEKSVEHAVGDHLRTTVNRFTTEKIK
jgi:hypothetical protein